MLEKHTANITELCSVLFIRPDPTEKKKRYGKSVPKYQLIYKLSGEVITHFNEKTVRILPGTVYIIPKCENADYYIERPIVGDCIDIFFDTDIPPIDALYCLDFSSNPKMHELFQKAYGLWSAKADGYYYKTMSVVYEILHEMIVKSKKYISSERGRKIEVGVAYIREHLYDREIDYYRPSKLCGMSYTYFKKLFVEKFGVPPNRYVNALRLEHAEELLLTEQYSVGEIASLCGFENVYYFTETYI